MRRSKLANRLQSVFAAILMVITWYLAITNDSPDDLKKGILAAFAIAATAFFAYSCKGLRKTFEKIIIGD